MGKHAITEHIVAEAGAPDAELAAQNDLVDAVLAQKDPIVELDKPECDRDENHGEEGEDVGPGRLLLQLCIRLAAPVRGKEHVEDDQESQVAASRGVAARRAKATCTAVGGDVRAPGPSGPWL